MITPRPSVCFAGGLLLAGSALAKSWTVTKYYAVQTSVSSWGEDLSITRTRTYPVKTDAPQPTNADAFSTYTSSRTYDSLDIVELYIAATEVGEDELLTSASFNNDYTHFFFKTWSTPLPTPAQPSSSSPPRPLSMFPARRRIKSRLREAPSPLPPGAMAPRPPP